MTPTTAKAQRDVEDAATTPPAAPPIKGATQKSHSCASTNHPRKVQATYFAPGSLRLVTGMLIT